MSQAVDKVDFSNRLCHTAFYIPRKSIKKEQFWGFKAINHSVFNKYYPLLEIIDFIFF